MSDYQTVTLILADGRRASYTGAAQMDPNNPPKVVGVEVSIPRPLPDGVEFSDLASIVGKWPGSETDAEVSKAMEELS